MNKRERIIQKYNGVCQICGKQTIPNSLKDGPELDHIIPRSLGGSNDENNMALLCGECNKKRSNLFGSLLTQKLIQDFDSVLGPFERNLLRYEYRNGTIDNAVIVEMKFQAENTFAKWIEFLELLQKETLLEEEGGEAGNI